MHFCPSFQTTQFVKHSLSMQNSRSLRNINSCTLPKLIFLGILFILSVTGTATFAQNQQAELGIILGKPTTGISYKYWTSTTTAFDIAAAWDFGDGSLYLHGDVLFHHYDILPVTTGRLPLYYGIGPTIGVAERLQVGVRIPVGLTYLFEGVPLSLFFELAPGLTFIPGTDFFINGGLGARYVF